MTYRAMILTVAMLVTAGAAAQDESAPPDFGALDTNADGLISPAEADADARVAAAFPEADVNRDGYLSAEEFADMWG